MENVQNLKKKMRKDLKKEINTKKESDMFWEKKTKTRKEENE